MAGSNELCGLDVITEICKKEHIRGNAEILKQLLAEFCEAPVTVLVDNSDVNDLGGGVYEIDVVSDPRDGYIAITEDLTFYEFDGTAWTLKFAGLGGFIASASDNGDDTYTFTSFDGNTSFTITIPRATGNLVDNTDPDNPNISISTDDSLFFEASTREMRSNIGQSTQTFTWNGGAQEFTLVDEPTSIVYVSVNGQIILEMAQWTIDVPNKQITITDPLDNGDVVVINYKFIITP